MRSIIPIAASTARPWLGFGGLEHGASADIVGYGEDPKPIRAPDRHASSCMGGRALTFGWEFSADRSIGTAGGPIPHPRPSRLPGGRIGDGTRLSSSVGPSGQWMMWCPSIRKCTLRQTEGSGLALHLPLTPPPRVDERIPAVYPASAAPPFGDARWRQCTGERFRSRWSTPHRRSHLSAPDGELRGRTPSVSIPPQGALSGRSVTQEVE